MTKRRSSRAISTDRSDMAQGSNTIRAGGTATAIGMDFQFRVGAWVAAHILAEHGATLPWDLKSSTTFELVRLETEQPVDDLLIGTSEGGYIFVQVKHSLSLERKTTSSLASCIDQFVRQVLAHRGSPHAADRPWERPLRPDLDRLVLITSPKVPSAIRDVIPTLLRRLRQLNDLQPVEDSATNKQERDALEVLQGHVARSWQQILGNMPTAADVRQVLTLMRVEVLDVDPGGNSELYAKNLLRTTVLRNSSQVDAAWNTLIQASAEFAQRRGGAERKDLQRILINAGIDLQSSPSYRKDIERLHEYTRMTLDLVSGLSRIQVGKQPVKIDRPAVLALHDAADSGSLVVVGEPGAGKSGALHDLVDRLLREDKDVVFLAVDRIDAQNLDGLRAEIGLSRYLSDVLIAWPDNKPGYLIIDALDAARSDRTAKMIHDLILQVISKESRWQIIVSIRKYDLRHNLQLRELFAGSPLPEFADGEFAQVRHVNIAKLTDQELAQVSGQAPDLASLISKAGTTLRELLRVPFNLRLVGGLLGAGVSVDDLTPIRTQIELLDRYWWERVIQRDGRGDERESVLRHAADAMVHTRTLHIDRARIADLVSDNILDNLLSSQILSEWQPSPGSAPNRYVLTFSHNVLFDYAVARLLFLGALTAVVDRLTEDPELVLAIGPSIVFHFQHIWFDSPGRQVFWDLVFRIIQAGDIREVGKLIGPSVAADLATQIADFDPLVSGIESDNEARQRVFEKAVRHVFGALLTAKADQQKALVGAGAGPWCELVERVSRSMRTSIAYIVRLLLTTLCEQPGAFTPAQREQAGLAARRLLEFAWNQTQQRADYWLTNHALQAVCRTFESNTSESANLIRRSIEPEHMSQHGFEEMPILAHEVGRFILLDPDLVGEIYSAVFSYQERSDAPTSISGSRILNLVSNRRQDYGMARYALSETFASFLQHAPIQATRALLQVISAYIAEQHPLREVIDDVFQFNDQEAHIVTDYSVIWDSGSTYYHDEPIKMLNAFSSYLGARARDDANAEEIRNIVNLIASQSRAAVIWKRLLTCGVAAPRTLGLEIRSLAWSLPILVGYDTTTTVGDFLASVYRYLASDDREQIERTILSIPDRLPPERAEAAARLRNRLIGCLPDVEIVTEEARGLLADLRAADAVPPNTPMYQMGEFTSTPYTDEDYLSDKGVSLAHDINRRMYDLMAPAKDFASRFLNTTPAVTDLTSILPALVSLHNALPESSTDVPTELIALGWGYLAEACERIAKCDDMRCTDETGSFVRRCLLEAAQHPEPRPDPAQDEQFDQFASWGSPSARVDAAAGLILLARQSSCVADEVLRSIDRLSRDPVPAVRFQIAIRLNVLYRTAPDLIWQILERYSREETSSSILQALVNEPLRRLSGSNLDHILDLAQAIYYRMTDKVKFKNARQACLSLFAGLYLWQGNGRCISFLQAAIDDPANSPDEARTVLLSLRELLTIGPLDQLDAKLESVRRRAVELMQRAVHAINLAIRAFESLQRSRPSDVDPEELEKIRAVAQLADTASMEIYFASGAFAESDRGSDGRILSLDEKQRFLSEAGPILGELADLGIAGVTHHIVETLEALILADPASVFLRLGQVVSAGKVGAYQFESLAADRIVRIVERYLAEYRYVLREDEECQRALLEMLDTFVEAGWPSARRLTYRLEEIFR